MGEHAVARIEVHMARIVVALRGAARHTLVVRATCVTVGLDDRVLVVLRAIHVPPPRLPLVPKRIALYPLSLFLEPSQFLLEFADRPYGAIA